MFSLPKADKTWHKQQREAAAGLRMFQGPLYLSTIHRDPLSVETKPNDTFTTITAIYNQR